MGKTTCVLFLSVILLMVNAANAELVGWWKFQGDETAQLLDSSGHENHGEVTDAVVRDYNFGDLRNETSTVSFDVLYTYRSDPNFLTETISNANGNKANVPVIEFNSGSKRIGDCVRIPHNESLRLNEGFAISLWVIDNKVLPVSDNVDDIERPDGRYEPGNKYDRFISGGGDNFVIGRGGASAGIRFNGGRVGYDKSEKIAVYTAYETTAASHELYVQDVNYGKLFGVENNQWRHVLATGPVEGKVQLWIDGVLMKDQGQGSGGNPDGFDPDGEWDDIYDTGLNTFNNDIWFGCDAGDQYTNNDAQSLAGDVFLNYPGTKNAYKKAGRFWRGRMADVRIYNKAMASGYNPVTQKADGGTPIAFLCNPANIGLEYVQTDRAADFDNNGIVDLDDFSKMSEQWLQKVNP